MNTELDALVTLLERHLAHYEHLADLLSREQAALIELDLDRLQQATKAKETTALKIKVLVPALAEAINEAAAALGVPVEPRPTLAELAGAAPAPYAGRLERAGLALARLKRGVARHNQDNHAFVQEALDLIGGHIAILSGAVAGAPKAGYLANGREAPAASYRPVRLSREV